ncbi:MAG: hypothetical protein EOO20_08305 [Chryseobacterium sp.]|nr:MAG: hypothetical protein EOO20_08305 [Chryseobacterium sp.]
MRTITKIFIGISLLFCTNITYAQDSLQYDPVVLKGLLSKELMELLKENPNIYYYTDYIPDYTGNAIKFPVEIYGNEFKVKIPMSERMGYFCLGNSILRSIYTHLFLIEAGDNLYCEASNGMNTKFTGKGSERLNFQLLYKLPNLPRANVNDSVALSKHPGILLDSLKKYEDLVASRIKSLPFTSDIAKKVLVSSTHAFLENRYIAVLSIPNQNAQMRKAVEDFYHTMNYKNEKDVQLLKYGFMQTLLNFQAIRSYEELKTKDRNKLAVAVYNNIDNKYTGLARDRLIALTFLRMGGKSEELLSKLRDVIPEIKDSISIKVLEGIMNTQSAGLKAFPFSFVGVKGETIRLEDFKGKIIILDTWFNGCYGCLKLNRLMEPIAKHFRLNKDVIFLSINAVDKYDRFISGVREGKYGAEQSIYGYTNGLGLDHPMIVYYQYKHKGFPNLLIIGKDGRVISSNPQWPLDQQRRENFIKLIQKHL